MFKNSIFSIVFAFLMATCTDSKTDTTLYPECFQTQIDNYLSDYTVTKGTPAHIEEYMYKGSAVYVFDPGSNFADWLFQVVDSSCEDVCEFGGIAGIQTCEDWKTDAVFVKTVWTDNR